MTEKDYSKQAMPFGENKIEHATASKAFWVVCGPQFLVSDSAILLFDFMYFFAKITNDENGRTSPAFDIIDGSEADSLPLPAIGSRMSHIFKARENIVKLHMAARELEFTEKYPFRYDLKLLICNLHLTNKT